MYQRNSRSRFSFRETNCEISLPPLLFWPQWLEVARAGPNLVRQKLNLLSSSFSTLHPIPHAPTDHQFWWALWLCQEWKILARFLSTLKYFPAKVSSVRFVVKFQRFQPLMNESLSLLISSYHEGASFKSFEMLLLSTGWKKCLQFTSKDTKFQYNFRSKIYIAV